jgi:hypothetical protein
MPKFEMERFDRIAGAQMRWRRMPQYEYGNGKPGARYLRKTVHDKLVAAVMDMGFMCQLGSPKVIVSAGAKVPQSKRRGPNDKHVQGRAIDIDALWWWDNRKPGFVQKLITKKPGFVQKLITKKYESYPSFYLGVEACFRRYFGTVLGWLYNDDHKGHWHIDDGSKVCYRESSRSRVLFMQASLRWIWAPQCSFDLDIGPIDGEAGKKTRGAIRLIRGFLAIDKPLTDPAAWQRYLLATAISGMSEIDNLIKNQ